MIRWLAVLISVIFIDIMLIVSCAKTGHAESFFNNGVEFKPQYIIQHNRVLIQLRDVSKQLGYTVMWFEKTGTVYVGNGDRFVMFSLYSTSVYVAGDENGFEMDTIPVMLNGRIYMPIRYVAQALGLDVDYKNRTIYLKGGV